MLGECLHHWFDLEMWLACIVGMPDSMPLTNDSEHRTCQLNNNEKCFDRKPKLLKACYEERLMKIKPT